MKSSLSNSASQKPRSAIHNCRTGAPKTSTKRQFATTQRASFNTVFASPSLFDLMSDDRLRTGFELVPQGIALGSGRFWFVVRQFDLTWHYPIQFKPNEVDWISDKLTRLDWTLDPNTGYPVRISEIHGIVEGLVNRLPEIA